MTVAELSGAGLAADFAAAVGGAVAAWSWVEKALEDAAADTNAAFDRMKELAAADAQEAKAKEDADAQEAKAKEDEPC